MFKVISTDNMVPMKPSDSLLAGKGLRRPQTAGKLPTVALSQRCGVVLGAPQHVRLRQSPELFLSTKQRKGYRKTFET